jgi:hypothetical protein
MVIEVRIGHLGEGFLLPCSLLAAMVIQYKRCRRVDVVVGRDVDEVRPPGACDVDGYVLAWVTRIHAIGKLGAASGAGCGIDEVRCYEEKGCKGFDQVEFN